MFTWIIVHRSFASVLSSTAEKELQVQKKSIMRRLLSLADEVRSDSCALNIALQASNIKLLEVCCRSRRAEKTSSRFVSASCSTLALDFFVAVNHSSSMAVI